MVGETSGRPMLAGQRPKGLQLLEAGERQQDLAPVDGAQAGDQGRVGARKLQRAPGGAVERGTAQAEIGGRRVERRRVRPDVEVGGASGKGHPRIAPGRCKPERAVGREASTSKVPPPGSRDRVAEDNIGKERIDVLGHPQQLRPVEVGAVIDKDDGRVQALVRQVCQEEVGSWTDPLAHHGAIAVDDHQVRPADRRAEPRPGPIARDHDQVRS